MPLDVPPGAFCRPLSQARRQDCGKELPSQAPRHTHRAPWSTAHAQKICNSSKGTLQSNLRTRVRGGGGLSTDGSCSCISATTSVADSPIPPLDEESLGTPRIVISSPLPTLPMVCGNLHREPLPPSQNVHRQRDELGSGAGDNPTAEGSYPMITAFSRAVGLRHLSANHARLCSV